MPRKQRRKCVFCGLLRGIPVEGWTDKPVSERKRNSRGGKTVVVDDLQYRKWCENCGQPFLCVNETRQVCDPCAIRKYGIIENLLSTTMEDGRTANDTERDEG